MHKNTLWLICAILCIYFSLVLCKESTAVQELQFKDLNDLLRTDSRALEVEARTRRRHRHHLYSSWGLYGLAIAYLVKIKVVVVAFFVGSAVYLGLRYMWPHHCGGATYKEGSIILDHPPSFAHHDHIPYSLDHEHYHDQHFNSGSFSSSGPSSFDPYSAYSSNSFEGTFPSSSFSESNSPPESLTSDGHTFRRKRSNLDKSSHDNTEVKGTLENIARQMVISEEQIGGFMLSFLGLDTSACRRRFICEMEFKSMANPLTSLAFRVIGRSFFTKYTNNQNPFGKATSFDECAAVNSECVFIENNEETEEKPINEAEQEEQKVQQEEQMETGENQTETTTQDNSLESNDIIEKENKHNFREELRRNSFRRRLRGDRKLL